ncbi:MAG: hypothetical protein H8F28_10020 [Fibrella sp.]|nr:hypothetical protein [Armatimonadota bacterium]
MRIHQITVLRSERRIKMTVEMPDPDRYLTSQVPHLPRALFRVLPSMATHTCHNDDGVPFRKECQRTEIPHLFEHLVLELQSQAQAVEVLRGDTEWNWRETPRGFFTVTVDYDNELLVIGAIKLAEQMIAAMDYNRIDSLDMPAEIARLRDLARIGREMEPMTFGFSAGSRANESGAEPIPTETVRTVSRSRRRVPRRSWNSVTFQPIVEEENEPLTLVPSGV